MGVLGIVLLLAGIGLLVAEAHVPTGGALGLGGVGALAAGCWLAIVAAGGGAAVAVPAAAVIAVAGVLLVWAATTKVAAARRLPVVGLTGRRAVVRSWQGSGGQVAADGALWRARLAWPQDQPPRPGERVVIEDIDGLTLTVRPAESWELQP
jgi:membrane-bound ClpP family serine protease